MIAFDSGNASFQMSLREKEGLKVYQGPLGYGTLWLLLAKEIGKGTVLPPHESGNPVSMEEGEMLVQMISSLLPEVPDWLRQKLHLDSVFVVTYGNDKSLFLKLPKPKPRLKDKKTGELCCDTLYY